MHTPPTPPPAAPGAKTDSVSVLSRTRRGGSQCRIVRTQAELEAAIMSLYRQRLTGRALLNNDDDLIVGSVEKLDGRWIWWFDSTALPAAKKEVA